MNQFFYDNYQILLNIVNASEGKYLLKIKHDFPVTKITPNSYHQFLGYKDNKPFYQATFFGADQVMKKIGIPLEKTFVANQYQEIKNFKEAYQHYADLVPKYNQYPFVFLVLGTFNPGAGEQETTAASGTAWAPMRNAGTSTSSQATPDEIAASFSTPNYTLYRCFQPFDTSSLGGNASVSASTWQGYRDDSLERGANGSANTDSIFAVLVPSNQATGTAYASTDFGSVTFTSVGSLANSSTTNNAFGTITISDQTQISTTGYTKLALITDRDLNNSAPTGNNWLTFQAKSQTNPPQLVVTYTSGGNMTLHAKYWGF